MPTEEEIKRVEQLCGEGVGLADALGGVMYVVNQCGTTTRFSAIRQTIWWLTGKVSVPPIGQEDIDELVVMCDEECPDDDD